MSAARTSASGARLTGSGSPRNSGVHGAGAGGGRSQRDHRADIYSFGIMAYEMLTGWPPFHEMSAQATLAAQADQKPEPVQQKRPGLPPVLADLVMRSLEKRPSDRPQTAAELLQDSMLVATTSGGDGGYARCCPRLRSRHGVL